MRREPALAALLCLVGAFLVLVAAGRDWAQVDVAGTGLLPGRTLGISGADLVPGVRALGLVALAGVVAIPASRRWGRPVVGVVLLLAGAGTVAAALLGDLPGAALTSDVVREAGGAQGESAQLTAWPALCALGGALVAAAGLLVAIRGRRWASLGRRYEPPAARADAPAPAERDLWEALDRGEDPTAADPGAR